jgi:hypothetical protein
MNKQKQNAHHSEQSTPASAQPPAGSADRRPFVEPELRREADMIESTAGDYFS